MYLDYITLIIKNMRKIIFGLVLVLFATSVFGAETRTYPAQGSLGFRGLDDKSSPTIVEDGRASDLQNVNFSTTFAVSKRHGYDLVNDSLLDIPDVDFPPIEGIYYNKFSNGTERVFAISGSMLYWDNSNTWTQIPTGAVSITSGQNNQFVFTTALDNVIATNNVNPLFKINSTPGVSNLLFTGLSASVTKANCVSWFRNYLIVANTTEGGTAYPTRIRWSNVGTVETWGDNNYIDISALGGQQIEGLTILYDSLYVFLTNSIWKVSLVGGDEVFVVSEVDRSNGCIAKNSIQNIELSNGQKGVAFLSKDKTINFFNGVNTATLSTIISTTMNGLSATRLPYCVSAYDGTDCYWSVSNGSSSTNNLILDFNTDIDEWTKHTRIPANAMARVLDSSLEYVYFGNYKSGVFQFENTSLNSDVEGETGTVDAVDVYSTDTASGLVILYDASATFTDATGSIVEITAGPGLAETKTVVGCTPTGIVVDSTFTTTPTTSSTYEMGAINAYYTTKWFDMGSGPYVKRLKELYMWTDEIGNQNTDVSYMIDFTGTLATTSINLSGGGGTWGTAIWGTSTWGGQDALFKRVKLNAPCRYVRFKFAEDDIDETFNFYSYSIVYELGDIF